METTTQPEPTFSEKFRAFAFRISGEDLEKYKRLLFKAMFCDLHIDDERRNKIYFDLFSHIDDLAVHLKHDSIPTAKINDEQFETLCFEIQVAYENLYKSSFYNGLTENDKYAITYLVEAIPELAKLQIKPV